MLGPTAGEQEADQLRRMASCGEAWPPGASLFPSTYSALHLGCQPHSPRCHQLSFAEASAGKQKVQRPECCLLSNKDTRASVTGAGPEAFGRFSFINPEQSRCLAGTGRACADISFPLPPPSSGSGIT